MRREKSDLLVYCLMAFGITWVFHLSIVVPGLPFSSNAFSPVLLLYLFGLLGPSFAALAVTFFKTGMEGMRILLRSALRWRFNLVWYVAAIGLVGVLRAVNVSILHGSIPPLSEWLRFSPALCLGQVWVALGEEYGWRGFALPRLQELYGSLGGSLVLGILWAAWHLPMFFVPGSPQHATAFVPSFLSYLLIVSYWSIIMTVLYNRTGGSVLVCMLFHASLNISGFSIDIPEQSSLMGYLYIPFVIVAVYLLPRPRLLLRPVDVASTSNASTLCDKHRRGS